MEKLLRILAALLGLVYLVIAVRWAFDPSGAATDLQMPLLEGAARNSQIGDVGALFLGMGALSLYGVWREKRDFLIAATVLIGAVAFYRVLGGLAHDAPTNWLFVGIELVTVAVWVAYARMLKE